MRTITIRQSASLAWRSPRGLRRFRFTSPDDASIGALPQRCAQVVGAGNDQGAHLVDGRGPVPGGGTPHQAQRPYCLHAAGSGLGPGTSLARLRGTGRGHGVDRVGLAVAAPLLTVWTAHFD